MRTRIDLQVHNELGAYGVSLPMCHLYAFLGRKWVNIAGYLPIVSAGGGHVVSSSIVELYPKTKVSWTRSIYPGSTDNIRFQGKWKDLCALPESIRVIKLLGEK